MFKLCFKLTAYFVLTLDKLLYFQVWSKIMFTAKVSEIFVRNLSEMHKKASEIKPSENKSSENLTSEIYWI